MAMKGMEKRYKKPIRRVVSIEFWRDDNVLDNFSPEDKLFMLYLLTNPQSAQVGVYRINKKTMAYELGYSIDTVTVLLDRFENTYKMIRYSPETHELAIKNYLRHSVLGGGNPLEDLLRREIKEVKDKSLLDYVFSSVINDKDLHTSVRNIIREFYAEYNAEAGRDTNSTPISETGSCTISATNSTPSIINNQLSSNSTYREYSNSNNTVVVDNINNARACAREGTNNNNEIIDSPCMPNAYGDEEQEHPDMSTLESYAANNIVNMNGRNMEFLVGYREFLSDALIRYAIDLANKCCKSGVPTYSYVEKILMRYVKQKITTVEQAQALEKNREAEKARSSPPNPAPRESQLFGAFY